MAGGRLLHTHEELLHKKLK
jgi:hypothetical protein